MPELGKFKQVKVAPAYLIVAWVKAMMIDLISDKIFPVTVSSITLVCCLLLLSSYLGFILAFSKFLRAGLGWARVAILSTAGIAFIVAMASTRHRDFPPGLLQEFVKLPWPFV